MVITTVVHQQAAEGKSTRGGLQQSKLEAGREHFGREGGR